MKRFRTNTLGVAHGSEFLFSDFQDNGEMWAGDGPRELRRPIMFDAAFKSIPFVQVGLSMWDFDSSTNQRADIAAEDITIEGFTLVFRTWGDTHIARVRVDWFAVGEVWDEDDWALY